MTDARIFGSVPVNPQSLKALQDTIEEIKQTESILNFQEYQEVDTFSLSFSTRRYFRPLEEQRKVQKVRSDEKSSIEEPRVEEVEAIEESASRYQKNNEEMNAKTLLILREKTRSKETASEIIEEVLNLYPDYSLADEALDFLEETPYTDQQQQRVRLAKEQLNAQFAREIKAGRNMGAQARAFSKEGLDSPTGLRDLYRDITGNPREPLKLFDELSQKFRFENIKKTIFFLLHSLGADLRSKGPSIERGELQRLMDDARSLQGILNIYRFFEGRMNLVRAQFSLYALTLPSRLNFEVIAKQFVLLLSDRFVSPDKVFQTGKALGISEETLAQIIIFHQMRDAIRQVSPRFYRNPQHRDELLKVFIKALQELEDLLEDEEEESE